MKVNNSWNPVLNFISELKNDFLLIYNDYLKVQNETYCDDDIYNYKIEYMPYENTIEYWVDIVDNENYRNIIKFLQINQHNDLVLIRYAKYSDIYANEENITNEEFWNMYNGFYRECRTIVIDIRKMQIVLCGFKKFFNINEMPETNEKSIINMINNAKCFEVTDKLDGSMQLATYYNNKIIISGSTAIDLKKSWRLRDTIKILNNKENVNLYNLIKNNPSLTFIFEYISLKDAHVVVYKKEQEGLYLIGIRDKNTGYQYSYNEVVNIAKEYNVKTVTILNKSFSDIINDTKIYKSNEKEGYVINIDGYLIKIKVDDYTVMSKILSQISSINLTIKCIADDIFDDYISKVPISYRDRILRVAKVVWDYIKNINAEVTKYYDLAPKTSRKDFMIWVNKEVPKKYSGYVKNMYLGIKNNYIKNNSGHYKRLTEMGYKEEDYSKIFQD